MTLDSLAETGCYPLSPRAIRADASATSGPKCREISQNGTYGPRAAFSDNPIFRPLSRGKQTLAPGIQWSCHRTSPGSGALEKAAARFALAISGQPQK